MSHRVLLLLGASVIIASCSGRSSYTPPVTPSAVTESTRSTGAVAVPRYSIEDLGTLGGSYSQANGVNNNGDVAGVSRTGPDTTCCDAVLWRNGTITNLGALGNIGSIVNENNPINDRDEVTGWVDTGIRDPNGENFCSVAELAICLPFVWRQGNIHILPVLGGFNAVANAINASGEIAGMAEHGAPDHICPPPQTLHFAAVVWSSKGAIRQLPAFPGDLDASAAGINDKGDVAGASGSCTLQPVRAVIWQNGGGRTVLPNLGGTGFNIAFAVNNKGNAVGQSDLPGDQTHHAALWRNGTVTDLGTLYGLPVSLANGINSGDAVVGFSQDLQNSVFVAELWRNGKTWDLNTLIPPNSGLFALEALGINNRGQIAGYAFSFAANDVHGFLATPVSSGSQSSLTTMGVSSATELLTVPQRQIIRERLRSVHSFWPARALGSR